MDKILVPNVSIIRRFHCSLGIHSHPFRFDAIFVLAKPWVGRLKVPIIVLLGRCVMSSSKQLIGILQSEHVRPHRYATLIGMLPS